MKVLVAQAFQPVRAALSEQGDKTFSERKKAGCASLSRPNNIFYRKPKTENRKQ
jgi:hypothetical protein